MTKLHAIAPSAEELIRDAVDAVRAALGAVPRAALPAFLAELELARVEALLAIAPEPEKAADRVLTPTQVAQKLGHGPDWAYRNRHSLPTVRLPGGRWGVPEAALERWLVRRAR